MRAFTEEAEKLPNTVAPPRIACFVPTLGGGGAERAAVKIADGMARRGLRVDLVVLRDDGPLRAEIAAGVRLVTLQKPRMATAIFSVARYLQTERPDAMISQMNYANLAAIVARGLARAAMPLVCVEQNNLSTDVLLHRRERVFPMLMRQLYPRADAIVAVSDGVARDLEAALHLPPRSVHTIYNPIVNATMLADAEQPVEHPWFAAGSPPVLLAVGRLHPVKGFDTLLQAFAQIRRDRNVRLLILGEGSERARLESLIGELGLSADVSLPGFLPNPYRFMRRAAAFVLSSQSEGLPTALIEAMACGCPVVSTDCPNGPNEILEGGTYGRLVPVGSPDALAGAIGATLNAPLPPETLQARAQMFSFDASVDAYCCLLDRLAPGRRIAPQSAPEPNRA